jgi:hypothetical protein
MSLLVEFGGGDRCAQCSHSEPDTEKLRGHGANGLSDEKWSRTALSASLLARLERSDPEMGNHKNSEQVALIVVFELGRWQVRRFLKYKKLHFEVRNMGCKY